ncbi:MAG: NACHT domain-containing protein, partial [Alphaproteobacteria bacterium]
MFDQPTIRSNILALVVVVLGLAAGAFRRHSQTDIPASRSLEDCESFLASSTLASEGAERARLIGRGHLVADALDIRYQVTPTGTPSQEARGGSFRDIVKFYRRTKTKRLVILGEAGSGKTVLALNLLVELSSMAVSGARSTGRPRSIPFQLHASLLLGPGDLNSCLAQALSERLRVPQRLAEQIVRRGRILPFIDGLDEIEISPRAAGPLLRVIEKLNEHIVGTGEGAMVVTCRADTYERLQAAGHGIGSSTAIRICDLTPSQCIAYIKGRVPVSSPTVAEWVTYLRDQSSTSQESAKALFSSIRTPWRLALLLAAVSDGLSVERFLRLDRSTEDLSVSRSCSGRRREDEVLDLLLSRYVPAAIRFRRTGKFADVENATRWLGFLSRSMSSDPSSGPEINIVPRDLWRIGGERAVRLVDAIGWTLPLAALLVAADVALLDEVLAHSRGAGWVLALALPLGLWVYYGAARAIYTRDPEPLVLRVELPRSIKQELAKVSREAFWQGAKSGLAIGLLFGAGIFLVPLISTGVTTPGEPFGHRVLKLLAFCVVVASLVALGNAVLRYLVNRRYVALAALPARTNYVRLCLTTLVRFFVGIVLVALMITVGIVLALLQNELAPLQQH